MKDTKKDHGGAKKVDGRPALQAAGISRRRRPGSGGSLCGLRGLCVDRFKVFFVTFVTFVSS
jgi:hypothetical protein